MQRRAKRSVPESGVVRSRGQAENPTTRHSSTGRIVPTEHQESVALATYLEFLVTQGKVLLYTKTAQETWTRSWSQKTKNRTEGVKPGLPDYLIVLPDGKLLVIELKRFKGGTVSEQQKLWIETLNTVPGVTAVVCKGFDEAKIVLDDLTA